MVQICLDCFTNSMFRNFNRWEPRDRQKMAKDLLVAPSRSRRPMNFLQPDRFMALCR